MICIKNGRVHDAVHETPYIGNILIEEDKIISIGSDFSWTASWTRPFFIQIIVGCFLSIIH